MALKRAGATLVVQTGQLWRRPLTLSSPVLAKDIDTQVTHTGQKFENDDYRLVRFEGKSKHVNKKFAIDLINSVPPAKREDRVVCCDGGGGPLGHPKVYINLDQPGNHICGYCGLRFTKPEHHH
ncbi:NADH dehydrogenase [ubiquinone] iron-sulfur protein 6, mitochondrial [Folsomia candida]|uniref:NADH dehydrogenase [ubiquinone] iron-sulfur protein 6, mitochondrial n=1 Tax=Folsomia candida TaxID=158441 RepID=A0A226F3X7_FOLCA|nr:NADH dehydrogenase [ubiquinone] iron-sulfur protein 6, mitochondrial [Folsomia candida]OXA64479.1 NADH dehydrogenase [ubiquinone] iron-sulfur protein 6, mitochondrial [Folsomia candida]